VATVAKVQGKSLNAFVTEALEREAKAALV
jgi:predicted HicB family RNase H-like nuclease